jgi:flagellar biosynthetic protein FliR
VNEAFLLIFARCAGFVFRAPGFSHPDVPPPVRAGFAFALALALRGRRVTGPHIGPSGFVFALATETFFGAAIGIAASMLYDGAFAGGRALDDYVGIRASVPSADVAAGAGFGRLWSLAFAAGFFVLGGDRFALLGFADAFTRLPPGTLVSAADLRTFAVALPETLLRAALFVAGPAIAIALVAQISLAAVARLVPRFSTFTLAFPVVFACVLLATLAALPAVLGAAAQPWWDLTPLHGKRP